MKCFLKILLHAVLLWLTASSLSATCWFDTLNNYLIDQVGFSESHVQAYRQYYCAGEHARLQPQDCDDFLNCLNTMSNAAVMQVFDSLKPLAAANSENATCLALRAVLISEDLRYIGHFQQSDSFLVRSLGLVEAPVNLFEVLWEKGTAYLLESKHDSAFDYLFPSLRLAQMLQDSVAISMSLTLVGITRQQKGVHWKAADYFLKSLLIDARSKHIGELGLSNIAQFNELVQKHARQKNRLVWLLGFLVILCFVIVVIYLLLRQRSKRAQKLELELENINMRRQNAELQYKLSKLEAEKMRHKLLEAENTLSLLTLKAVQRNELVNELVAELDAVSRKAPEKVQVKLFELSNKLLGSKEQERSWQEFEAVFMQIHPNFFANLREKYPELTSTETRLCALICQNLSTHEIASLLHIEPASVNTARYRLRKKMNLEKTASLSEIIKSLE